MCSTATMIVTGFMPTSSQKKKPRRRDKLAMGLIVSFNCNSKSASDKMCRNDAANTQINRYSERDSAQSYLDDGPDKNILPLRKRTESNLVWFHELYRLVFVGLLLLPVPPAPSR